MTLGRRLVDFTGSGLGYNSSKQCVIRLKGSKTFTPGIINDNNYFDWPDGVEILQDPYNFIGTAGFTTGFGLRKTSNFYAINQPTYTVKLSTISGSITSNDSYFNINFTCAALGVFGNTSLDTNITPNISQPYYSTSDAVEYWLYDNNERTDTREPINGSTDWTFWTTDRNPGGTASPTDYMAFNVWLYKAAAPPSTITVDADLTFEIRRSNI